MRWLVERRRIVSLSEYIAAMEQGDHNRQKLVALTFDDGFAVTFQCVFPFLVGLNIPATIFVSTGHLASGELLWFTYLKALCFEKLYQTIEIDQRQIPLQSLKQCADAWDELRLLARASGNPVHFCRMLAQAYPLTREVTEFYGGMSHDQIQQAGKSRWLDLGAHTISHPYLDQLERELQQQEIVESKRTLDQLAGTPVRYFAYPGGEYNQDSLEVVKAAGFQAAFAVISKSLGTDQQYEIGRIGVYAASLFKLQVKTFGAAGLARRFGLRVG